MAEAITVHNLHPALAAAFSAEAHAISVVDRRAEGDGSGMIIYSVADRPAEGRGSVTVSLVEGASLEDVQKRVHARYIAESRRLDAVDLPAVLRGEFNPIHERIDALVTPVMDLAKIRKVVRGWQWP